MSHGYSLRSDAKGRRGHKSTNNDKVEGTSISTSTGSSSTRERRRKIFTVELEGDSESGIVDLPNSNTPDPPTPSQGSIRQPTLTSSVIRVADCGRPEAWQDIQAARQREEARHFANIRREQIVRVYDNELLSLRERIGVLRGECESEVERTRRRWARKWAFERGEVAVVVEEPSSSSSSCMVPEAAQSMAWTRCRPEGRVPSMTDNTSEEAGRETEGLATPNVQGVHCHAMLGPSWALAANAQEQQLPGVEESGRTHHPHQLRRQQGQLMMVIPTDTSSVGQMEQMETRGNDDGQMDL